MDDTPLNVWSRSDEDIGRQMSHFAHTPFVLDGVAFGSVEAFYTWLISSPSRSRKWRRFGALAPSTNVPR